MSDLRLIQTHSDSFRLIQTHSDSFRLIEPHWASWRCIRRIFREMTLLARMGMMRLMMKSHFLKRCSLSERLKINETFFSSSFFFELILLAFHFNTMHWKYFKTLDLYCYQILGQNVIQFKDVEICSLIRFFIFWDDVTCVMYKIHPSISS